MKSTSKALPTIIAVDPSWTSSGVAIFENGELVETRTIKRPKDSKYIKELMVCKFFNMIANLEGPLVLAIETQFIPKGFSSNSVAKVIEAKGIIEGVFLCLENEYKSIIEVHPLEAKQSVGIIKRLKRSESKKAVKEAVLKLYPYPVLIHNQDISDAVAIGHAAIKKIKAQQILQKYS